MVTIGYFKPLRRKLGVVTLVMACVLMVGWVRSHSDDDRVYCPLGANTYCSLRSSDGTVILLRADQMKSTLVPTHPGWFRKAYNRPTRVIDEIENSLKILPWQWERFGFGTITFEAVSVYRLTALKIPYWSLVIPLTLLSAWLLLSKSRAGKPTE